MKTKPKRGLKGEVYALLDYSGISAMGLTDVLVDRHQEWNRSALNYLVHSYLSALVHDGFAVKCQIRGSQSLYALPIPAESPASKP